MENINQNSENQLQQVSHPLGRHSIKDVMTNLGIKSKNSVNDYKKMVKVAFKLDLSRVLNEDKTLTDEGLQQLKFAKKFAGKKDKSGYTQAVWQANPDLAYELPTPVITPTDDQSGDQSEQGGAQVGQPTFSTNFDPFAGIKSSTAIAKREITALDMSESSAKYTNDTNQIIATGQNYLSTAVQQLVLNGEQIGDQLGDMISGRIIERSEQRIQQNVDAYAQSKGITVKKQSVGAVGNAPNA